tara:strand:- start:5832 stop:6626 length:795 start_codon:yes stop_codon:yes gene_type:complete
MNIGIVGVGVVGSAIRYGFEKLGHDVKVHDLLLNTSLSDVFDTEVCYICVPTPSKDDGACDTSIVEEVVSELSSKGYTGTVAVKSTVTPGTTQRLIEQFSDLSICFVPEFLRERCAETDFTENHDLCIVGTSSYEVFNLVKDSHGKYPKEVRMVTPTEAELCKYFNNTFNSTLITFANSFFEICESLNSSYTNVKDCMVMIDHIPDKYLDCNKSFRGFGGMCLPKDTKALNNLCESKNLPVQFFKMLLDENNKYETTVYKGMRK